MSDTQANILELIRREGLIVVAIAALGWQVYFLTSQSQQQDQKWREELAEYRGMIVALDEKIGERWIKMADSNAEMNLRMRNIEADLSVLIKNCQTCKQGEQPSD